LFAIFKPQIYGFEAYLFFLSYFAEQQQKRCFDRMGEIVVSA